MEAATPLRLPRVSVFGEKAVVLDGVIVDDPCAVALVRRAAEEDGDPVKVMVDAIEIGARVLDREQASAQTEYVRAEFEKASREVEAAFTDKARVVAEHFGRKVDEVFAPDAGVFSRSLEKHFAEGSSTAVQHRVKQVVEDVLAKSREDLLRQFSSSDGLLADFKRGVTDSVRQASERSDQGMRMVLARMAELQVEVEKLRGEREKEAEVAAEAERGTAKGRTFEEAVAEALDEIAVVQGDDCDAVGDVLGAGGKKGDVVVAIEACRGPARGRIVFEAKDANNLTKKKALETLEASMEQRGAQYAVLVVRHESQLPARCQGLREYNGTKLFVAYDPFDPDGSRLSLEVAYALARARVLMARAEAGGLDTGALAAEVERAVTAMEDVRRIKSQLTAATGSIDAARTILEAMAKTVRDHLATIDELVTSAQAVAD